MIERPELIEIRAFREADRDAVRDLFIGVNRELAPAEMREAFEGYVQVALREEIDRIEDYYRRADGSGFWVVFLAGSLVGMFGVERLDARRAELRRMYVAPERRRKGLARRMLDHAERFCRESGYEVLVLSTSEVQQAALALYLAAGFTLVGEETAEARSNKTVGGGIKRYKFEKPLSA